MHTEHTTDRFIRLPELIRRIGLGRSSIYNKMNPKSKYFDKTFPRAKRLGANAIAWLESEVAAWIQTR